MITNLIESVFESGGSDMHDDIVLAITDLKLHNLEFDKISSNTSFDPLEVYKETISKLKGFQVMEGTNYLASWDDLGSNGAALYHTYLWSKAIGDDMYSRTFKGKGVLSPEVGTLLRNDLMAAGTSSKPEVLLKKFLKIKHKDEFSVNMEPFLKFHGLKTQ